jgi:hypothetical protein
MLRHPWHFYSIGERMSIDKKSIHVRVPPELHDQLSVMADFLDKDIAEEAARILARGIVAAFYEFSIAHERMTRLGLKAKDRE